MVSANESKMALAAESTFGTPSATAADYKTMRRTQNSLQRNRSTAQSQILVSSRGVDSYNINNVSAGGDVPTEFHFDAAIDLILTRALYSVDFAADAELMADNATIQVDFTGATGAVVAASGTPFATVSVGDWLYFDNTTDADKDGLLFKVLTKASSLSITVAGKAAFADATVTGDGSGANCVIYKPGQITNGTTQRSLTAAIAHDAAADLYTHFPGCIPSSLGVNATPGNPIQLSTTFLAKDEIPYPTSIGGTEKPAALSSGWAAAGSNTPFSAVETTGFIMVATPTVNLSNAFTASSWSFNLNNNLRPEENLFVLGASAINPGQFVVEGTLEAYYKAANHDLRVYTKGFTTRAMVFQVQDLEGNRYLIDFPSAKFLSDPTVTPATNTDVKMQINWGVVNDATESIMCRVVRVPFDMYT